MDIHIKHIFKQENLDAATFVKGKVDAVDFNKHLTTSGYQALFPFPLSSFVSSSFFAVYPNALPGTVLIS